MLENSYLHCNDHEPCISIGELFHTRAKIENNTRNTIKIINIVTVKDPVVQIIHFQGKQL